MNSNDFKKAAVFGVAAGVTVSAIGLTGWLVWGAISTAALAFAFLLLGVMELKSVLSPMWPVAVGAGLLVLGLLMTVMRGNREEVQQQISLIGMVALSFAGFGVYFLGHDPSIAPEQAAAANDAMGQLVLNIKQGVGALVINGFPWFVLAIGFLGMVLGSVDYFTGNKRESV